jgi:hypothetical protein
MIARQSIPRTETLQYDIDAQLRPVSQDEAVIVLARVMARVCHRDIKQFPHLTAVFRQTFSAEHNYLCERHRSGGPGGFRSRSL